MSTFGVTEEEEPGPHSAEALASTTMAAVVVALGHHERDHERRAAAKGAAAAGASVDFDRLGNMNIDREEEAAYTPADARPRG